LRIEQGGNALILIERVCETEGTLWHSKIPAAKSIYAPVGGGAISLWLRWDLAWLSKGTNPRAISRRPRKAKAGVTYIYSEPLLPLTLTMFGQVLSSRAENPFPFTAGKPKIEQVVLCKSGEQPIACQVRELG
jgi:hypothetical protein